MSAPHPRHHPCCRYLRHDDEEGVDEDDDTDAGGPHGSVRLRKRREDVGEERAANHHQREVARDQGEQEPIPGKRSEPPGTLACRRSVREAGIRDPDEHDKREDDERDGVEEVEGLERPEVMGGGDDQAGYGRAEAEAEVACDSAERGGFGALLCRNEGQGRTWPAVPASPKPAPATAEQTKPCHGRSMNAKPAKPSALTTLPAIRSRFALKRSSRAPEGSVTSAAVPMTAASTSPAVAVENPRTACR